MMKKQVGKFLIENFEDIFSFEEGVLCPRYMTDEKLRFFELKRL